MAGYWPSSSVKNSKKNNLRTCVFSSSKMEASVSAKVMALLVFTVSCSILTRRSQKIFSLSRKLSCERQFSCTRFGTLAKCYCRNKTGNLPSRSLPSNKMPSFLTILPRVSVLAPCTSLFQIPSLCPC